MIRVDISVNYCVNYKFPAFSGNNVFNKTAQINLMGIVEVEIIIPPYLKPVNIHERNFPRDKFWMRIHFSVLMGSYSNTPV